MARILLGVTGSIAAYKSCELTRLWIKAGHQVQVMMTPFAEKFVGPMTFAALTGNPVFSRFEQETESFTHLDLARSSDVLVIAPCDANTLSKIATGIADNLLSTVALAFEGPFFVAPAMNRRMWEKKVTQENIERLLNTGIRIIPPEKDILACQEEGFGKMARPESIVEAVEKALKKKSKLRGKNVLISAGATREFLDPVRFISNPSSGKMGLWLAREAASRGASVFVVKGATETSFNGIPHIEAETSQKMKQALLARKKWADVLIMAAAVADFKPHQKAKRKLERKNKITLELEATKDILKELAASKGNKIFVGFCLGDQPELLQKAREKLKVKGVDLIVANTTSAMRSEEAEAMLVTANETEKLPRQHKAALAAKILDRIERLL